MDIITKWAEEQIKTKKCSKCGELKHISEFNKHSRNKDGLAYYCKMCARKYEREHKAKKINIVEKIQNKDFELKLIDNEVYANANSMTDSTTLDNWKRSDNTKRYLEALNKTVKSTELIISKRGGKDTIDAGTWIHEKLVLSLARYISVDFEIWCDTKIAEFISGNNRKQPALPKSYKDALLELVSKLEENENLQLENNTMQPKAEFYDSVIESESTIDIGQIAKTVNVGLGRNKLFEFLREKNILMKGNNKNVPFQKYIDAGYFKTIESSYKSGEGKIDIHIKTVVYQKGVEFIVKLLKKNGYKEV